MIKQQPQYTAAETDLNRAERTRFQQSPECHAADRDLCVDASGAPRRANHIERVRGADNDIFNTPETTADDSPIALAFTGGYLLSWQRGPTLARLTAQEHEVGARALNPMMSGRSLLEARHKHGRSLDEIAARQDQPLYVIAEIYSAAVRDLAANVAPLLKTCCGSCLQQMPEVVFDPSLRCPRCRPSLPQHDKPIPNVLDVEEFKVSCAALETTWTASVSEIEAAYEKRLSLWNSLIKSVARHGGRHPQAETALAKDNEAWKLIESYRSKYGH